MAWHLGTVGIFFSHFTTSSHIFIFYIHMYTIYVILCNILPPLITCHIGYRLFNKKKKKWWSDKLRLDCIWSNPIKTVTEYYFFNYTMEHNKTKINIGHYNCFSLFINNYEFLFFKMWLLGKERVNKKLLMIFRCTEVWFLFLSSLK